MSTALELVNRIRVKRRSSTQSIITDKEGVAFLDFVNSAITSVLEERTWNFQYRSDGVLKTAAKLSFTLGVVSNGSTAFTIQLPSTNADLIGNVQCRMVVTSDATFGDTNLRVVSMTQAASSDGVLEYGWPGTTDVLAAAGYLFSYEYILPSTVRSITSVRHQESDLTLLFENAEYTYDRLVPRAHDYFSDEPQFVMVGGEVIQTVVTGSTGVYGLAMRIYPAPESALYLNYSYIYRQPVLTVLTSTLNRVPPVVEDLIVELATSRVITSLEKDVQTGLPLEARILREIDRVHRNHAPDAGKRTPLQSLDHVGRGNDPNWPPRTIGTLSGV